MQLHILQALHQLLGNNTPQAKRYAQNPRAAEFVGRNAPDPANFGYPADNTPLHLKVLMNAHKGNLGVPTGDQPQLGNPGRYPQLGQYNPGYTPLQNSGFGPGGNPQIRAFNQPTPQAFNPQDNPYQQYWN